MSWNIAGCSTKCAKCSKEFEDDNHYHCRLSLAVDGPQREDYCAQCWEEIEVKSVEKYSYWQGRYKSKPVQVKEEPIKEDVSKRLLKKWIDSTERLHQCFCYILSLMLLRKKSFQQKPSLKTDQGKEQLVYEDRETGETYVLEDPRLTLQELDQVEGQLQEMLKKELED